MQEDLKDRLNACLQDQFDGKTTRLAKAAGINESTIRGWLEKWKSGQEVNPNAMALFKVSQACGVSVEWLITGQVPTDPCQLTLPASDTRPLRPAEKEVLDKTLAVLRLRGAMPKLAETLKTTVDAFHHIVTK